MFPFMSDFTGLKAVGPRTSCFTRRNVVTLMRGSPLENPTEKRHHFASSSEERLRQYLLVVGHGKERVFCLYEERHHGGSG